MAIPSILVRFAMLPALEQMALKENTLEGI